MPLNTDQLVLDQLAAAPTAPPDGAVWYNSTDKQVYLQKNGAAVAITTLGSPGSGGLVQETYDEQDVDVSITSKTWVDLLSVTLTTIANSKLLCSATISALTSNSGQAYYIRLVVDGVALRGASCYPGTSSFAHSCSVEALKSGLAAGTHTVKLQWKVSNNTLYCRPVSQPDQEHASLYVEEVSV